MSKIRITKKNYEKFINDPNLSVTQKRRIKSLKRKEEISKIKVDPNKKKQIQTNLFLDFKKRDREISFKDLEKDEQEEIIDLLNDKLSSSYGEEKKLLSEILEYNDFSNLLVRDKYSTRQYCENCGDGDEYQIFNRYIFIKRLETDEEYKARIQLKNEQKKRESEYRKKQKEKRTKEQEVRQKNIDKINDELSNLSIDEIANQKGFDHRFIHDLDFRKLFTEKLKNNKSKK